MWAKCGEFIGSCGFGSNDTVDAGEGSGWRLSVAEGDAALGEIVGGKLEGDFIAGEDADAVAAEAACEVGQDDAVMFEFDAEEAAGKLL
jgi:hypothetical protein